MTSQQRYEKRKQIYCSWFKAFMYSFLATFSLLLFMYIFL